MSIPILTALMESHDRREAQTAYQSQLLWQMGAMLHALLSGGDFPTPDYFTLFPARQEVSSAASIHRRVLRQLRDHGSNGS